MSRNQLWKKRLQNLSMLFQKENLAFTVIEMLEIVKTFLDPHMNLNLSTLI